ncbi:hypothetical protein PsYK624_135580 [Phanerochaete sordida]|uniref:Uncharacterized protein n=1 Tax=Phanerochaete sordida TaxID=48140 RepID=A0A9P3GKU0_9APHY|nr:hypothetical protein PsYK624_135580 [Phanerochaete sordida]
MGFSQQRFNPYLEAHRALDTRINIVEKFMQGLSVIVDPFVRILPLILICCFIVNLRQIADYRVNPLESSLPSVRFATLNIPLGDIGGSLDYSHGEGFVDSDEQAELESFA